MELWVHCVPPRPTLPTLAVGAGICAEVPGLTLSYSLFSYCHLSVLSSHSMLRQVLCIFCFGPREMSGGGGGVGVGGLSQAPGLSQPISHLDAQSYTSCFFALEARTNFEG